MRIIFCMVEHDTQRYEEYNTFILRHREAVWHTCWRFAKGNRTACEDMVQEVWIALWLKFDQLRTDYSERQQRAWVKRVTRSVLVDLYRRSEPEPERLPALAADTLPTVAVSYADEIDDLMAMLPADDERLMRMRLEGYDAQEIADAFGIERNAVYQRVNRIITKLRKSHGTRL
ncbi:MAG: sigma-70 family RNA polymerase sigma factor [Bacteroidales bacterium]|nr:sigma-70 family RNA polymerase sigma factor [Bacteroidales bacterium]